MAKEKVTKKSVGNKKMTPYNKFMKSELAKIKADNPNILHKDAFKKAAQNWATSEENPKNKK